MTLKLKDLLDPAKLVENKKAIAARDYKALREAAYDGNIERLECMLYIRPDCMPKNMEDMMAPIHSAIQEAAGQGRTQAVIFLFKTLGKNGSVKAIQARHYLALRRAAAKSLETTKLLLQSLTPEDRKAGIQSYHYEAIQSAAANGRVDVLKALFALLTKQERIEAVQVRHHLALQLAVRNNHLDVLAFFKPYITANAFQADDYQVYRQAVQGNKIQAVKEIEIHLSPEQRERAVTVKEYEAIGDASANGDLEMVIHLMSHLGSPTAHTAAAQAWSYGALRRAAAVGSLSVIQYLIEKLSPEKVSQATTTCNYAMIRNAAENGHAELVDYVLKNLIPSHAKVRAQKEAILATIKHRLGPIKRFQECFQQLPLEKRDNSFLTSVVTTATKYNNLHVLQQFSEFLSQDCMQDLLVKLIGYAAEEGSAALHTLLPCLGDSARQKEVVHTQAPNWMAQAAKNGHTNVIQGFLLSFDSYKDSEDRCNRGKAILRSPDALNEAICNGHTDTLRYMANYLDSSQLEKLAENNGYSAMKIAAKRGYTDTVCQLLIWLSSGESINCAIHSCISVAAQAGHFFTVHNLFSGMSVHQQHHIVQDYYCELILNTAQKGHKDIVSYLFRSFLFPQGQKDAAKWLLRDSRIPPDIRADLLSFIPRSELILQSDRGIKDCIQKLITQAETEGYTDTVRIVLAATCPGLEETLANNRYRFSRHPEQSEGSPLLSTVPRQGGPSLCSG